MVDKLQHRLFKALLKLTLEGLDDGLFRFPGVFVGQSGVSSAPASPDVLLVQVHSFLVFPVASQGKCGKPIVRPQQNVTPTTQKTR
jgi:hypothetical protein